MVFPFMKMGKTVEAVDTFVLEEWPELSFTHVRFEMPYLDIQVEMSSGRLIIYESEFSGELSGKVV